MILERVAMAEDYHPTKIKSSSASEWIRSKTESQTCDGDQLSFEATKEAEPAEKLFDLGRVAER